MHIPFPLSGQATKRSRKRKLNGAKENWAFICIHQQIAAEEACQHTLFSFCNLTELLTYYIYLLYIRPPTHPRQSIDLKASLVNLWPSYAYLFVFSTSFGVRKERRRTISPLNPECSSIFRDVLGAWEVEKNKLCRI